MKILALAFLLLIGVLLTADAFGHHINRGYVYFARAFSLIVELLNLRLRKKSPPTRAI
jgi:predicted tellurium resistance membrane protein TerC